MRFIQQVKESIVGQEKLLKHATEPAKSAFGYFFTLIAIVATVQMLFAFAHVVVSLRGLPEKFVTEVTNAYPAELVLKYENGVVSSNVQEPYFITISDDGQSERVAVIDTKTPYNTDQHRAYGTPVWITNHGASMWDREAGKFQTFDMRDSEVPAFTLNQSMVKSFAEKIAPWLVLLYPLIAAVLLFLFFLVGVWLLAWNLFGALIAWIVTRMKGYSLKYGQAYELGLRAMTLPILVTLVLRSSAQWTHFRGFPFLFTLIFIMVLAVNIPQKTHHPVA